MDTYNQSLNPNTLPNPLPTPHCALTGRTQAKPSPRIILRYKIIPHAPEAKENYGHRKRGGKWVSKTDRSKGPLFPKAGDLQILQVPVQL